MQLLIKFSFATFVLILAQSVIAANIRDERDSLNAFYDNLLQREYQLQRKAQRSPSLRLRFGKRSDSEMLTGLTEKPWFGDVNQKHIRSPSLRLRFGRRSDATMPLRSPYDMEMNGPQDDDTNNTFDSSDDYNDISNNYERVIRKPQRLRFGRSPTYENKITAFNDVDVKNIEEPAISNTSAHDIPL
ncbi:short neuropeptide F-like [Musca autumnalis]|uniref:short neuropeptide F-like n=1 Tax=Musca autumnalis TaxID=221902 RepID=UPI003CEFC88C